MRATVGICHAPGAAATIPEILAACGDEYEPVLILVLESEDDHRLAEVARHAAATVTLAPDADIPGQAVAALAAHDAAGIVTFSDRFVKVVDEARRIAGLPGRSGDSARWQKDVQRSQLAAAGLFSGAWRTVDSVTALRRAVMDVGLPAIAKPTRGSGSAGILVLRDEEDVARMEAQFSDATEYVVETYLGEGCLPQAGWLADYVSVESATGAAARRHFGITLRPPIAPPVRETGSVVSDRLTDDQTLRVLDAVDRALDALDITHLVTHTEVKIRPDAIEVMEVNGRLGGYVEGLTQRRVGRSAARLALDTAIGEVGDAPSPAINGCHLLSLLFPAPLNAVELLQSPDRAALIDLPGVWRVDGIRSPGPLDPAREGTSGYVCSMWVEADSATGLYARGREAVRAIAEDCVYQFENGSVSSTNRWAEAFDPLS
jgi:biotin carboxylase